MSFIPRDATVVIGREFLLDIARTLKTDPAFQMNFLMDLTAVDFSAVCKPSPLSSPLPVCRRSRRRSFQIPIRGPALQARALRTSITSSRCR